MSNPLKVVVAALVVAAIGWVALTQLRTERVATPDSEFSRAPSMGEIGPDNGNKSLSESTGVDRNQERLDGELEAPSNQNADEASSDLGADNDRATQESEAVLGMIPSIETLLNSDYMTYDRETLLALTETGDRSAISVASINASFFTLEKREQFVRKAVRFGDTSGLPRMYLEYSAQFSQEPKNVDSMKAYAYLLASRATGQLLDADIDMSEFEQLTEEQIEKAEILSASLINFAK